LQELPQASPMANTELASAAVNPESSGSKDALVRVAIDKLKETKKSDDEPKNSSLDGQAREESIQKSNPEHRTEASRERNKEREKERERDREREDRSKARDHDRGRDSDRERDREEAERDRDKVRDRNHRSKDRGKDIGIFTTELDANINVYFMSASLIFLILYDRFFVLCLDFLMILYFSCECRRPFGEIKTSLIKRFAFSFPLYFIIFFFWVCVCVNRSFII
jgi:hypothetical protein